MKAFDRTWELFNQTMTAMDKEMKQAFTEANLSAETQITNNNGPHRDRRQG